MVQLNNISGIYKIINVVSGKFYIGQSINLSRREYHHFYLLSKNSHYNIHLQNSWNKHGGENFRFEIIEHCKIEDLDKLEQFYINTLKPEYNLCIEVSTSPKGLVRSPETRKKLGDSKRGILWTQEQKDRLKGRKFYPHTEEAKIKISKKNSGKGNGMYGKPAHNRGRGKLKDLEVLEIRRLHATGKVGYHNLGKLFKVKWETIRGIVKRTNWAWLDG